VAHHLLGSYQRAFLAILLAQFTRKRFTGGMCGVVRLATSSITVQVAAVSSVVRFEGSGFAPKNSKPYTNSFLPAQ
jgi:hypothetical protein